MVFSNAKKVTVDGIKFDSIAESEMYRDLKILQTVNEIRILELQPKVYLTKAKILYKPDFLIEEKGGKVWIEVKGRESAVWRIKRRLWMKYGPGALKVYKKQHKLYLFETIKGKSE